MSASRESYSPDSSVRISSSSTDLRSAATSVPTSASVAESSSDSDSSRSTCASSTRERSRSMRFSSPCTYDSLDVTCWARDWSSHRSGADACSSRSALSRRIRSTSNTDSIVRSVVSNSLRASLKSATVTATKPTRPGYLLGRGRLEPRQRGPVVADGELQGGGPEVVAVLLGVLGCLARFVQRGVVVLARLRVDLLQLRGGLVRAERDAQRGRTADRLLAGRLGEPPGERALAGRRDGVRLAGPGAGLTELDVAGLGEGGQFPVDLAARHRPER